VVGMLRVPDGRGGMCNRAGLLGGLGTPVNRDKQCQAGGCACCCTRWRGFWVGYFIFGYIRAIYIHLGHFGTRGRAGGSAKVLDNAFQKSRFPIRQLKWCQLGCSSLQYINIDSTIL